MAHLGRRLPAVGRILGAGLEDDGSHLLIGTLGRSQIIQRSGTLLDGLKGQLAAIVDLIQHQAQGVGVHGGVEAGIGVHHLGDGVQAAVAVRQGCKIQGVHGDKAQIAHTVLLIVEQVDVAGLQVHVEPAGLPADGQCGAHIDTQIHSTQMGHGVSLEITLQCPAVAAEQVDLTADPILHGDGLAAGVGDKAPLSGQLLQGLGFLQDALGAFFKITLSCLGVLADAGQQQCIDLNLGGGHGDLFDNISLIRIFLHGRAAADAMVVGNGITQLEPIQHGGDQTVF